RLFGQAPLVVGPGVRTGVPILYDNPKEVGADRIANAVAATERIPGPAIVVDFGTATTFDVVTAKGEYAGGVIVPGIGISLDALIARTAKLPRVELAWPPKVAGRTTVHAIQSGVTYGYTALADGMVERIPAEQDTRARAIANRGRGPSLAAGWRRSSHRTRAPSKPSTSFSRSTACVSSMHATEDVMSPEEVAKLRNVAIVGQGGTGKTSVADALLFAAGAVTRI